MRWIPFSSYVILSVTLVLTACTSGGSPTESLPTDEEPDPPVGATRSVMVESGCEPLAGMEVRLFADEGTTAQASLETDAAGAVAFDGLDAGRYAVEVDPSEDHGHVAQEEERKSTHLLEGEVDSLRFMLVPDPQPPITDHEGTTYQTVKIGDRVWMAENLRVTTFANGDEIPRRVSQAEWQVAADEELPGWVYYQNDAEIGEAYGPLYNNHVAVDPRGVCPAGWRVPTEADWQALELQLGIREGELERIGLAGGLENAGAVLKSTRTEPEAHPRWRAPNGDAMNCTGFSGVGHGYRIGHPKTDSQVTGRFVDLGGEAPYWSATPSPDDDGHMGRGLIWSKPGVYRNSADGFGFSIRCVKDS